MIISASRRTDIPAFYSDWFMNRIREGFLLTRNPFNAKQVRTVSLSPSEVEVIVFWTRNPEKIIKFLPELNEKGFLYYFQYTITGFPKVLEKSVPRPQVAIDTFKRLSDLIGAEKVIWRFDPILISSLVDIEEHERLFEKIATSLQGKTKRVVISFADMYAKVNRNLKKVENLSARDVLEHKENLHKLSSRLVEISKQCGMKIESCSEDVDLSQVGVSHGKCIDDGLIKEIFGVDISSKKDKGQREACGCIESVDIGQYNSCLHGCTYCYATENKELAIKNFDKHDPLSPFLIGSSDGFDLSAIKNKVIQIKQNPLF